MIGARVLRLMASLLLVPLWPAHARMHPQMYCWDPDIEFPVHCSEDADEEEDDDEARPAKSDQRWAYAPRSRSRSQYTSSTVTTAVSTMVE